MILKLPYEKNHRVPRSILLLLLLPAFGVAGCGFSGDDADDETARTETTRTETATTTTQTVTAPEDTQSTDTPSTAEIQGASPGVPSAPQGATAQSQAEAQSEGLTAEEAAEQEETGTSASGTTGSTGSAPPDAAGNVQVDETGAPSPVVGASGGETPTSRFGAFEGARPFSDSSPWNTAAQGLPVDPRSSEMMRLANIRIAIRDLPNGELERFEKINREGLFINRRAWAPPIYTEQGGVTTALRCRQLLNNCGDVIEALSIPSNARPDPRYDGWFTVYDSPNGVAYDFWRARREADGSISYHFIRRWDLNDSGYLPPEDVSARGSGLPLFAGVITPQDIQAGRIDHALAISVPGAAQRRYVQPASRTDGNGNSNSLPEGARIRLATDLTVEDLLNPDRRRDRNRRNRTRQRTIDDLFADQPEFDELDTTSGDPNDPFTAPRDSVTGRLLGTDDDELETNVNYDQLLESLQPNRFRVAEDTRRRITEMILDALRRYGAIVVDRSAVPTLYAQRNVDWRGILTGGEVQGIQLSDFEVIQLGPIYFDPPLDTEAGGNVPGQGGTPGVNETPQAGTTSTTTTTTPTTTTTTTPTTTTETTSTTEAGE